MFTKFICLYVMVVWVCGAPPTNVVPLEKQQPTVIAIVAQSEELESNGTFKYSYETANGIKREETSYDKVLPKSKSSASSNEVGEDKDDESNEIHVQQGSYSYTAPDGSVITVRYIADENGFRPIGDHLPKAPAVLAARASKKNKAADNAESGSEPAAAVVEPSAKDSNLVSEGPKNVDSIEIESRIGEKSVAQVATAKHEELSTSPEETSITTEIPSTTANQSSTAQAESSTTTEIPSTTADQSSTTQVESSTTTEIPSTTADQSSTTQVESSTTTEIPSTTADQSSTTQVESSTTTEIPSTTADQSSTTEEESSTTTEIPSITTDQSSTTQVESSTTTEIPSITTDQFSTIQAESSKNTEIPSTTPEQSSTTQEESFTSTEIPATTVEVSSTPEISSTSEAASTELASPSTSDVTSSEVTSTEAVSTTEQASSKATHSEETATLAASNNDVIPDSTPSSDATTDAPV